MQPPSVEMLAGKRSVQSKKKIRELRRILREGDYLPAANKVNIELALKLYETGVFPPPPGRLVYIEEGEVRSEQTWTDNPLDRPCYWREGSLNFFPPAEFQEAALSSIRKTSDMWPGYRNSIDPMLWQIMHLPAESGGDEYRARFADKLIPPKPDPTYVDIPSDDEETTVTTQAQAADGPQVEPSTNARETFNNDVDDRERMLEQRETELKQREADLLAKEASLRQRIATLELDSQK